MRSDYKELDTNKIYLVTGAAGFIGFHLSKRLLEEGCLVIGIDNLNDYYDVNLKKSRLEIINGFNTFKFYKIDLQDKFAVDQIFNENKIDIVVNLAAQAGVRYSITNPDVYIQSNIVGFFNILEACRHHNVEHLVYASSSSVYGMNEVMPFSVHHNVDHPISLYAATKKSNELMAHTYSHLYNLPTTGLRFFTVYGPWGRPDMALFLFTDAIVNDKPIKVYNYGKMKRDFTYIDDIIEGVVRLLSNPPKANKEWDRIKADPGTSSAPYKIYNIGNNKPVELMEFIKTIERYVGKKAKMEFLPMQAGDVPMTYADVDDLIDDVGFKPDTSIDEGIRKFVEWYKEYYGVKDMARLKVLHIISNLGSGGAEKLIEESLPIMNNTEGVKVDLLLLSDKGNVFDKGLKESGVNIDVIPIRQYRNPLNIFYISRYIAKGKYDVVHAHLFPTIYWVSIASKLMICNKIKFIYTEHSTHNRRRDKKYLRFLEKFIYSSFDRVISVSKSTQKNLIDWLKPKAKDINKFVVINNGININKFKEAEPYNKSMINNKFTDNTKLLCMVSRFSEAKDQATVIKSMKYIPEDVHLLLVGEGPLKDYNKKLAEDIGVSNRVHFLGFRNDVERIIKTSDIIVQSSNWEGFGLSAVEAMAAGKPVIASDVPGLREVVDGAGILFQRGNSEVLANEINELIINRQRYNKVVNRCLNRSNMYYIDLMVAELVKAYLNIL